MPQQIVIKLTSDFPKIFDNLGKLSKFINHLITKETNNQFYLEIIEKGVIYFFDNQKIYMKLNKPLTQDELNFFENSLKENKLAFLKKFEKTINPSMLVGDILNEKKFPIKGITIFFNYVTGFSKEIIQIRKKAFESFNSDDLTIKIDGTILSVKFLTYKSLLLYLYKLSLVMS